MNTDRNRNTRSVRAARFEWSAWLAAALVLLVVAPALHAQQQQTLAPLYSALLTAPAQTPQAAAENARTLETALAVLQAVGKGGAQETSIGAGAITSPRLVHADGSTLHLQPSQHNNRSFLTPIAFPAPHRAPSRVFTAHVVLHSALTAGEAPFRSGTRNNRSHE